MTEAEWLACPDPRPLLDYLRPKGSQRKFLLFAVACCRRIGDHLPDERSRAAVGVIEGWADGQESDAARKAAAAAAHRAAADRYRPPARNRPPADRAAEYAACAAAQATNTSVVYGHYSMGYIAATGEAHSAACTAKFVARSRRASGRPAAKTERRFQAALLRDIFGNPFRPVTADPKWLTSAVVGLAQAIYDERGFDRMPILADALEEAGCGEPAVLAHCRSGGRTSGGAGWWTCSWGRNEP